MVSMIRSIKIVFFLLYSNRLVIYTIVPKLCCSYYDASIGSATVFSCLHSCWLIVAIATIKFNCILVNYSISKLLLHLHAQVRSNLHNHTPQTKSWPHTRPWSTRWPRSSSLQHRPPSWWLWCTPSAFQSWVPSPGLRCPSRGPPTQFPGPCFFSHWCTRPSGAVCHRVADERTLGLPSWSFDTDRCIRFVEDRLGVGMGGWRWWFWRLGRLLVGVFCW